MPATSARPAFARASSPMAAAGSCCASASAKPGRLDEPARVEERRAEGGESRRLRALRGASGQHEPAQALVARQAGLVHHTRGQVLQPLADHRRGSIALRQAQGPIARRARGVGQIARALGRPWRGIGERRHQGARERVRAASASQLGAHGAHLWPLASGQRGLERGADELVAQHPARAEGRAGEQGRRLVGELGIRQQQERALEAAPVLELVLRQELVGRELRREDPAVPGLERAEGDVVQHLQRALLAPPGEQVARQELREVRLLPGIARARQRAFAVLDRAAQVPRHEAQPGEPVVRPRQARGEAGGALQARTARGALEPPRQVQRVRLARPALELEQASLERFAREQRVALDVVDHARGCQPVRSQLLRAPRERDRALRLATLERLARERELPRGFRGHRVHAHAEPASARQRRQERAREPRRGRARDLPHASALHSSALHSNAPHSNGRTKASSTASEPTSRSRESSIRRGLNHSASEGPRPPLTAPV